MKVMPIGLALVLALAPLASAHPGHEHKFMGTVSMIHENHLEVTSADGKKKVTLITLNEKTKVVREKTALKIADITVGARVVVTAIETKDKAGKVSYVAKEVRLGAAPAVTTPRRAAL